MNAPTVKELPQQAEPADAAPVLACRPEREASAPLMRELDRRRNDGIDVRLLWNHTDDRIVVTVFDAKTSDAFNVEVAPHNALDAFHHPYAYAPNVNGRAHNELAV